jgi:hypothetical protein
MRSLELISVHVGQLMVDEVEEVEEVERSSWCVCKREIFDVKGSFCSQHYLWRWPLVFELVEMIYYQV